MHGVRERGKELGDVFSVLSQFQGTVRENKCGCLDCNIPSNEPLAMCIDDLVWLRRAEEKLNVPHVFGVTFVVGDGILASKDMVQVDISAGKEAGPLRVRVLWEVWQVKEG